MPYSALSDLPAEVRSKYRQTCQRAFMHAFNSTHEGTGSESRAFAAGHAAAQRCERKRSSMSDVKFNIFTKALSVEDGPDDGRKRLRTIASSTIKDLAGDEITLSGLQRMAETAEQNMTIFLNHKYQVPEDVLGSVEKTNVIRRDGDLYDLEFFVRVDEANERAVKTWQQIQNGTKLGCSIGARIPEGGYEKTDDGLKINDVHLLEASIVGIPANPRSFVQYAVKALHDAESQEDEEVAGTINLDLGVDGAADTATITVKTEPAPVNDVPGPSGPTEPPRNEEPAFPEEDAPSDDEEDEGDTDVNEAEEATKDVPATQEAPEASAPESDGADEIPQDFAKLSIETLQSVLKSTTTELVEARKALATETESRVKAEEQARDAEENLKIARQIVERIAALPIGRRTGFAKSVSDFRTRFGGIYSDGVIKLLERKTDAD